MVNKKIDSDFIFAKANGVIIVLYLCLVVYPLWYVLCASFSNVYALINKPILLLPTQFTLDAYKTIFETKEIWIGFRNSFIYMIIGTIINISITLLTAFPLSRDSLPGKKWMTKVLVLTMYISGGMIPTYLVVDKLQLTDSPLAMIIPNMVSAYFVIISISFIKSTIPESILEAARIDGCGNFKMFLKIVLPLSTPLIGVLALQYGLAHWNSYSQAMIYLTNRDLFPLQLILREILIKTDSSSMMNSIMSMAYDFDFEKQIALREGIKYGSMVVTSVPLLIIYPFLKNYFAKGLVLGGVKE